MKLKGVIQRGVGKGTFFTQLDWVVVQFEKTLGFRPFPGTLNVRICTEDVPKLEFFFSQKDGELVPDNPEFCSAWLKKVWVDGIPGAAVFPSDDVRVHEKAIIEVMAGCHLKERLRRADGDQVTITDGEKEL
jgi:riboflavin kinase